MHTLKATAANVHDVTITSQLLHGEEDEVYGDSGYLGADKREDAILIIKTGQKIEYEINLKPSLIRKLPIGRIWSAMCRAKNRSKIRLRHSIKFCVKADTIRQRVGCKASMIGDFLLIAWFPRAETVCAPQA